MQNDDHYNINRLLSYNRFFNMVISERGLGKTYSATKYMINRFLKHGEQFVYVRRYKPDLKEIDKFFDAIINEEEFPNHDFAVNGKEFIIDGNVAGYAIALSTQSSKKSTPYPNVTTIFFDEFLIDKGDSRYIYHEPEKLLSLIDTIVRRRTNWRCLLMANAITVANPYFLYFDIQPNLNKEFSFNKDNSEVLVQIPRNPAYREERLNSRWGNLVKNTPYGRFAIENKFSEDTNDFMENRTKQSKYICTIVYQNQDIGFWADYDEGKIFASEKVDPTFKPIVLTTKDHKDNRLLIDNYRSNSRLNYIIRAFKQGYLFFEDQKIKHSCLDVFRLFNLK